MTYMYFGTFNTTCICNYRSLHVLKICTGSPHESRTSVKSALSQILDKQSKNLKFTIFKFYKNLLHKSPPSVRILYAAGQLQEKECRGKGRPAQRAMVFFEQLIFPPHHASRVYIPGNFFKSIIQGCLLILKGPDRGADNSLA